MTFRDEDIDTSLTPILKAGQVGVEAMLFWSKVCAIKNANPSDLSEQIDTAYNETVGRPEIQSLIADRELWLQK